MLNRVVMSTFGLVFVPGKIELTENLVVWVVFEFARERRRGEGNVETVANEIIGFFKRIASFEDVFEGEEDVKSDMLVDDHFSLLLFPFKVQVFEVDEVELGSGIVGFDHGVFLAGNSGCAERKVDKLLFYYIIGCINVFGTGDER